MQQNGVWIFRVLMQLFTKTRSVFRLAKFNFILPGYRQFCSKTLGTDALSENIHVPEVQEIIAGYPVTDAA